MNLETWPNRDDFFFLFWINASAFFFKEERLTYFSKEIQKGTNEFYKFRRYVISYPVKTLKHTIKSNLRTFGGRGRGISRIVRTSNKNPGYPLTNIVGTLKNPSPGFYSRSFVESSLKTVTSTSD